MNTSTQAGSQAQTTPATNRAPRPLGTMLLCMIAGLLALNFFATVMVGPNALEPRAAHAQVTTDEPTGFVAAAEQRKQMINELKSVSARLERIEAQLKSGISVKVLEMPADKSSKK